MRKHLSLIVPVRNEDEYIRPFYYDLLKHISSFDYEIIWVNNASTDSTSEEIQDLMNKDHSIRCITLKTESSAGAAVICGLNYAKGEMIIIMKGDLQHPGSSIPQIIKKLENQFDIIKMRPENANQVSVLKRRIFDIIYKSLPAFKYDSDIEISDFLGLRKEVVNDILFTHNHHFFVEQFFNWQEYTIGELNYENRRYAKHLCKYTHKNLMYKLKEYRNKKHTGILRQFALAGKASVGTGIIGTLSLIILNQIAPEPLHPIYYLAAGVLFLLGIQMILLSNYKIKLKEDLFHCSVRNQYLIKNIYDLSEQTNAKSLLLEKSSLRIRKVS